VNCKVKNAFTQAVRVTPYMADFLRDRYGEALGGSAYDQYAVDLKAGETKQIQVPVTLPTKAQAYDTSLSLRDGKGFESNTIFIHYVLRGASATIQQISLDKTSYALGSSAVATVAWSASADSFPGSRVGSGTTISGLTMNLDLSSGGTLCGKASQELSSSSIEKITIPVNASCYSPRLRVSVSNKGGEQLAVGNYFVPVKKTVTNQKGEYVQAVDNSLPTALLIGFSSALLLLVALMLRKKKQALVIGLLIVCSLGFATHTNAATVSWKDKGNNVHTAYVDLDADTYHTGESVNMTTNFDSWYQWCTNGAKKTISSAYEIKGPNGNTIKVDSISNTGSSNSIFYADASVPSGTYNVNVYFGTGLMVPETYKTMTCQTYTQPSQSCMNGCSATMSAMQGQFDIGSCMSACPIIQGGQTYSCEVPATYKIGGDSLGSVSLSFTVEAAKDKTPQGAIDSADCNTINGWTFDGDVPGTQIDVHVYKDGPAGSGSIVGGYNANTSRPDINSVFGVPGNHGIGISIPDSLKDGQSHALYVYAIGKDASGNNNGNNPLLPGSPKTIKCDVVPKTCTDSNANNVGESLPCTYNQKCTDTSAANYGGDLPCTFSIKNDITYTAYPSSVAAGSSFSVTVHNSGSKTWGSVHYVSLATNTPGGGVSFAGIGTTAAGGNKTISLQAPSTLGTYYLNAEEQGVEYFGSYPSITVTSSCSPNQGATCTSSANSCGQTNTGTYGCDGTTCSASTPSESSCGPVDVCPNMAGNQSTVPSGMTKDASGNCLCSQGVACGGDCEPGLEKDVNNICYPTFTLTCPASGVKFQITDGFGALSQSASLGVGAMSAQTINLTADLISSSLGTISDAVDIWNGAAAASVSVPPNGYTPTISTKVPHTVDKTATYRINIAGRNEFGITKTCNVNLDSIVGTAAIKEH